MNINSTNYANVPMVNITPSTDSLRRDNVQREVIIPPVAVQKPGAEKGTASDFDKAKTPGQNEYANQIANREQADANRNTIGDGQSDQEQQEQSQQQGKPEQNTGQSPDSEAARIEQQQIAELKARDAEVRAHEAAHATVGGSHAGAPSFTYQSGPDGKKYAVGGEVSVDLSRVSGDPQATIQKMRQVHAAALAPANPSSQDMKVAATAMRIMAQAQQDLAKVTTNPESNAGEQQIGDVQNARLAKADNDEVASIGEKNQTATLKETDDPVAQAVLASDEEPIDQAVFASEEDRVEQAVFASEATAPVQEQSVIRRSLRIQNFYMNINPVDNTRMNVSA